MRSYKPSTSHSFSVEVFFMKTFYHAVWRFLTDVSKPCETYFFFTMLTIVLFIQAHLCSLSIETLSISLILSRDLCHVFSKTCSLPQSSLVILHVSEAYIAIRRITALRQAQTVQTCWPTMLANSVGQHVRTVRARCWWLVQHTLNAKFVGQQCWIILNMFKMNQHLTFEN